MPTPNDSSGHEPRLYHEDKPAQHSLREGYELTDVSVRGILVFLGVLGGTILVFFVFAFGFGKVIDVFLRHSDGNTTNQAQAGISAPSPVHGKGIVSSPAIEQRQLQQLTAEFPTPRLQTDDGDQDLTDLHAREDLLLGNYSYIDQAQGRVRIPISRAMQLIAERGLPVLPATTAQPALMYGDVRPELRVPLTNGFARTGYEQERSGAAGMAGEQASSQADNY
jgi:hypothetical protein